MATVAAAESRGRKRSADKREEGDAVTAVATEAIGGLESSILPAKRTHAGWGERHELGYLGLLPDGVLQIVVRMTYLQYRQTLMAMPAPLSTMACAACCPRFDVAKYVQDFDLLDDYVDEFFYDLEMFLKYANGDQVDRVRLEWNEECKKHKISTRIVDALLGLSPEPNWMKAEMASEPFLVHRSKMRRHIDNLIILFEDETKIHSLSQLYDEPFEQAMNMRRRKMAIALWPTTPDSKNADRVAFWYEVIADEPAFFEKMRHIFRSAPRTHQLSYLAAEKGDEENFDFSITWQGNDYEKHLLDAAAKGGNHKIITSVCSMKYWNVDARKKATVVHLRYSHGAHAALIYGGPVPPILYFSAGCDERKKIDYAVDSIDEFTTRNEARNAVKKLFSMTVPKSTIKRLFPLMMKNDAFRHAIRLYAHDTMARLPLEYLQEYCPSNGYPTYEDLKHWIDRGKAKKLLWAIQLHRVYDYYTMARLFVDIALSHHLPYVAQKMIEMQLVRKEHAMGYLLDKACGHTSEQLTDETVDMMTSFFSR